MITITTTTNIITTAATTTTTTNELYTKARNRQSLKLLYLKSENKSQHLNLTKEAFYYFSKKKLWGFVHLKKL